MADQQPTAQRTLRARVILGLLGAIIVLGGSWSVVESLMSRRWFDAALMAVVVISVGYGGRAVWTGRA